jgi:hypothetical protein
MDLGFSVLRMVKEEVSLQCPGAQPHPCSQTIGSSKAVLDQCGKVVTVAEQLHEGGGQHSVTVFKGYSQEKGIQDTSSTPRVVPLRKRKQLHDGNTGLILLEAENGQCPKQTVSAPLTSIRANMAL